MCHRPFQEALKRRTPYPVTTTNQNPIYDSLPTTSEDKIYYDMITDIIDINLSIINIIYISQIHIKLSKQYNIHNIKISLDTD